MNTVITQVGLDKAIDASLNGVSIEITHVGFGTVGYEPERSRQSLSSEELRLEISGGNNSDANQIHLTCLVDRGEFACKEIGFYLSDGTLFAVMSMPVGTIFYKQEDNSVVQAFDLVLDVVPVGSITVNTSGDLSLYYAEEFAVINTALTYLQIKDIQTAFNEIEKSKITALKQHQVQQQLDHLANNQQNLFARIRNP